MAPDRLKLKSGIDPRQAIETLRGRIDEGKQLRSFGVEPGHRDLQHRYLEWAETTEVQLRFLTWDPALVTILQTRRHWEIRQLHGDARDARPVPLIQLEVELQLEALERLLRDLEERVQRFSGDAHAALLDTNVLLHYQAPASVDWTKIVEAPVRLIVPLRVVEELDEKKYDRRSEIADVARRLLPQLEATLTEGGGAGSLRDGVTIEVPVASGPRTRPTDADQEVLESCLEVQQFSRREATLITGDTAMRIRAEALGVSAREMPSRFLRRAEARGD